MAPPAFRGAVALHKRLPRGSRTRSRGSGRASASPCHRLRPRGLAVRVRRERSGVRAESSRVGEAVSMSVRVERVGSSRLRPWTERANASRRLTSVLLRGDSGSCRQLSRCRRCAVAGGVTALDRSPPRARRARGNALTRCTSTLSHDSATGNICPDSSIHLCSAPPHLGVHRRHRVFHRSPSENDPNPRNFTPLPQLECRVRCTVTPVERFFDRMGLYPAEPCDRTRQETRRIYCETSTESRLTTCDLEPNRIATTAVRHSRATAPRDRRPKCRPA